MRREDAKITCCREKERREMRRDVSGHFPVIEAEHYLVIPTTSRFGLQSSGKIVTTCKKQHFEVIKTLTINESMLTF